jgi:hypothetical protein
LREVLDEARRGTPPRMVRTGATFADAAAEWLRYVEHDRGRKPSTVSGYRSIVGSELLPRFGDTALESVTRSGIEKGIDNPGGEHPYEGARPDARDPPAGAQGAEPAGQSGRRRGEAAAESQRRPAGVSPEEVWALVRAAGSDADGACPTPCAAPRHCGGGLSCFRHGARVRGRRSVRLVSGTSGRLDVRWRGMRAARR